MRLDRQTVFVTGANRGIGKALVEVLLKRNVAKVYAAAREIGTLPDFGDSRVAPVRLDITDPNQALQAAAQAGDVRLLVNNAGALAFASVVSGEMDMLKRDMDVNFFGTLNVTRAFVPAIAGNGGGAIASVSSVVGLASMAGIGGYSASKAALFSAVQAMRAELRAKNIAVHGIFPGPIDTDMARPMEMAKAGATATATAILDGIVAGREDIYPDLASMYWGEIWARDPKALEREFSSF